jgi:hypothetical protein
MDKCHCQCPHVPSQGYGRLIFSNSNLFFFYKSSNTHVANHINLFASKVSTKLFKKTIPVSMIITWDLEYGNMAVSHLDSYPVETDVRMTVGQTPTLD